MTRPAIESVIAALVSRLEAVVPSLSPKQRFKRTTERARDVPASAGMRSFNLDFSGGQDDSQEGVAGAVQNAGLADRRARIVITVGYPKGQQERHLEDVLASDGEWAMRGLARSADWTDTPITRATCRTTVDRTAQDKLLLVLQLEVQYRDVE